MTIRPAAPADVPAVLALVARTCAFHEAMDPAKYSFLPNIAARYERWLTARATDSDSVFLVAEADRPGELAGFLVGTTDEEIPIYRLKRYGFVHDVWVEPAYRRHGLARRLVELAARRFAEIGAQQLRLDVAAANAPARRLFESCGLRPSVIEMLMELPKPS